MNKNQEGWEAFLNGFDASELTNLQSFLKTTKNLLSFKDRTSLFSVLLVDDYKNSDLNKIQIKRIVSVLKKIEQEFFSTVGSTSKTEVISVAGKPEISFVQQDSKKGIQGLSKKFIKKVKQKVEKYIDSNVKSADSVERSEKRIEQDIDEIIYKQNASEIKFGNELCPIPATTNQEVLCQKIFTSPLESWVKEIDVKHDFYSQSDSSFYNAQRLLNETIEDEIGISDFIEYSTSRVRINKEYRSLVQSESES